MHYTLYSMVGFPIEAHSINLDKLHVFLHNACLYHFNSFHIFMAYVCSSTSEKSQFTSWGRSQGGRWEKIRFRREGHAWKVGRGHPLPRSQGVRAEENTYIDGNRTVGKITLFDLGGAFGYGISMFKPLYYFNWGWLNPLIELKIIPSWVVTNQPDMFDRSFR